MRSETLKRLMLESCANEDVLTRQRAQLERLMQRFDQLETRLEQAPPKTNPPTYRHREEPMNEPLLAEVEDLQQQDILDELDKVKERLLGE
ncbi:MAG: uncharacterized protein KVP18_002194 [Porospora cf. gigantea A]|uniref:uncharacterized protein n=1 Tax=Porospora cf. gigantea A TaxID=2853593 RepID=UPI00355A9BA3|nr:MAG: hypothetical protein KVP18_002194 [Porospora cf. gigantea A]